VEQGISGSAVVLPAQQVQSLQSAPAWPSALVLLLIYLLLEHKSYRDAKASFQVLRYIVHQGEDWLRQKQPLYCILPMVIYNGLRPWSKSRSLHQIFHVPQECSAMFPQFQVSVLDLPRMEGRLLHGTAEFLAAASLLRSYFQPDLEDHIPAILTGLKGHLLAASRGVETPDSPVPAILRYAATRIPLPELQRIIAHTFKGDHMLKTQAMKSAAEVWYEEGKAKGKAEGWREGRLEGEAIGHAAGLVEGRTEGRSEGRLEGRSEGLLRGSLIGQIQLLQQLLGCPVSTDFQLDQLSNEALTTHLSDLGRQRTERN